jgi:prepilin-type processing-associated H-X9-DG protein
MTRRHHRNDFLRALTGACALAAVFLAGCRGKRATEDSRPAPPEGGGAAAPKELPADVRASQEKLRQIGKAFVKEWPSFPAGYVDGDGRPLLSWRVALLPLLGQEELFRQFRLSEPWDGPNNKKLLARMPDVYRPVKGQAPEGHTYYRAFVGEQAVFPPRRDPGVRSGPGVPFAAWGPRIIDGTSYTFLVVEAGEPVPWTKPDELPYDPQRPLPRLGGPFGGDFNALFADGSVHLIPRTAPERLVRALVTPAGQEPVDLSEIGLPDPRRQAAANPEPPPVPGQKGTVTGRVTYQGQPVPGGTIIFYTGGPEVAAKIEADGTYTLADVPVGYAGVAVRTNNKVVPQKYGNVTSSGLGYTVKGGKQTYDINLVP